MPPEIIDGRTVVHGYPKPHPDNLLETDAPRIAQALDGIDGDIDDLEMALLLGLDIL